MKTPNVNLTLLLSLLVLALPLHATDLPDKAASVFDRLHRQRIISVTLEIDMQQLQDDRKTTNKQLATFHDGKDSYAVEVEVRGRFRRRVCEVPPLKLKFSKKWLLEGGLNGHNDLKLVTHCVEDQGREYVLREQLTYELYGLLTNQSYRTQLVEITYVDTRTGASDTQLGIIIEDTDEMAERMGGKECDDCYSLTYDQFVYGSPEMVTLFQYMIGNADWNPHMQRNVKLVELANGQYSMVPYDFDFSGIVNAEYALPNYDDGQTEVGQRVWQWKYGEQQPSNAVRQHFMDRQQLIMQHIENYDLLSKKSRREISKYIGRFYDDLQSSPLADLGI